MIEETPARQTVLAVIIGWATAIWSAGFAINTVLAADHLTSPQWRALMTIPGGKWFWVILFGAAATILAAGLNTPHAYRTRAIGSALLLAGCSGIAIFYMIAPLFNLGPITLGYWPWFFGIALGLLSAVFNWWPFPWP